MKPSHARRRRFQRHTRVVTKMGGRGCVVAFFHPGEYLVLIDGTDIPMRYTCAELSNEVVEGEVDASR